MTHLSLVRYMPEPLVLTESHDTDYVECRSRAS
jgi:hypothetical protein